MWGLGTPSTLREIRPYAGVGVTARRTVAPDSPAGILEPGADPVSREELRHITRFTCGWSWQPVLALIENPVDLPALGASN